VNDECRLAIKLKQVAGITGIGRGSWIDRSARAENVSMKRSMVIFLGLLAAGCAANRVAATDAATRNLVVVQLVYEDRTETVSCQRNWAVWMEWAMPGRVFRLYEAKRGAVTETADFIQFLASIEALPHGIEIERFDTCGARCGWGISDREGSRLMTAMRTR
jgi:hypothetical protein